jgi:hypothetical protein
MEHGKIKLSWRIMIARISVKSDFEDENGAFVV